MSEVCRVRLIPRTGMGCLPGNPSAAIVTTDGLKIIGSRPDYANTPLNQINQCDRSVTGNPPAYQAEVDTNVWHVLLTFPTEHELDRFVRAVWAVVLARYPHKNLSRYGQDYAPRSGRAAATATKGGTRWAPVVITVTVVLLVLVAILLLTTH